jgi:hypothetical protein
MLGLRRLGVLRSRLPRHPMTIASSKVVSEIVFTPVIFFAAVVFTTVVFVVVVLRIFRLIDFS